MPLNMMKPKTTIKLLEAIAQNDDKKTWGDIQEFIDKYNRVKFNRRRLNQLLKRYDFDTPNILQAVFTSRQTCRICTYGLPSKIRKY